MLEVCIKSFELKDKKEAVAGVALTDYVREVSQMSENGYCFLMLWCHLKPCLSQTAELLMH